VRYLSWLSREDAIRTINEHRFFLMPSEYEGFGQSLYEAAGCGGIILTTNAAPMNEIPALIPECQISVSSHGQMKSAITSHVSADGVAKAVHAAAGLPMDEINKHSVAARSGFLSSRKLFRNNLSLILGGIGA
jgi:glycosyltransferase involved in cell wall biosynthesis